MTSQEKGERAALCGRISDVSENGMEERDDDGGGGGQRTRSGAPQSFLWLVLRSIQSVGCFAPS